MIEFATLFLFLVTGVHDVHLMVGAGVTRADVLVDGVVAAEVRGPPWGVAIDFGDDLAPHELTAIARDDGGREIGRSVQRINRATRPTGLSAVVREEGSRWVAQVEWLSVTSEEPRRVKVSVDAKPVAVSDPKLIVLPAARDDRLHVMRVELSFDGGLVAATDVVFGHGPSDDAAARLTAIPIRASGRKSPPGPDGMAGWFKAAGGSLRVVAVEESAADIVFVVDRRGREHLDSLMRARVAPSPSGIAASRASMRKLAPLKAEQLVSVVGTQPSRRDRGGRLSFDLFPRSLDRDTYYGGLLWILAHSVQSETSAGAERIADAVALAGVAAAERDRRRAVVLIVAGDGGDEASELLPEQVKSYLERLGVPLMVWCVDGVSAQGWGTCVDVSSTRRLEAAAERLSDELDRQRIVWVEGRHARSSVSLAPAKGVEVLGGSATVRPRGAERGNQ